MAILDQGRLVAHDDTDRLPARGTEVSGPAASVDEFTDAVGLRRLSERRLGGTKAVVAYGDMTEAARRRGTDAGLTLGPTPLPPACWCGTGSISARRRRAWAWPSPRCWRWPVS